MGSLMDGVTAKHVTVVVAKCDEFTVERDGLLVHILDGEGTIRLTMPALTWYALCAGSLYEEEV